MEKQLKWLWEGRLVTLRFPSPALRDQISLGDAQSNYLLTTAENELGVVVAHSESGELAGLPMLAFSRILWFGINPLFSFVSIVL